MVYLPSFSPAADGWDGGRNNFVNGYHDNRMTGGNTFNRGPPRMERGRGGVGGGYRGNRGGGFNPMNQAQPMPFVAYDNKGGIWFNCMKHNLSAFTTDDTLLRCSSESEWDT